MGVVCNGTLLAVDCMGHAMAVLQHSLASRNVVKLPAVIASTYEACRAIAQMNSAEMTVQGHSDSASKPNSSFLTGPSHIRKATAVGQRNELPGTGHVRVSLQGLSASIPGTCKAVRLCMDRFSRCTNSTRRGAARTPGPAH